MNEEWDKYYANKDKLKKAQQEAPIIAIDASYEALMNEREQVSFVRQIITGFSFLKKAKLPFSLHIVNCKGYARKLFEGAGSFNWSA